MTRGLRILLLAAALVAALGGAHAQSPRSCGLTGSSGSLPANCPGTDDMQVKSSQFQGSAYSRPYAISSPMSTRMALGSDGYAAVPYLGYELGKNWWAGVSADLGRGNQPATTFGQSVHGGVERSYAAASVSAAYWFGRGQFSTRFSLLHGEEKLNRFTLGVNFVPEIKSRMTQAAATARYGYWFGGFMPYASLTLTSDLERSANPMFQSPGRSAWIPRIGVDFFSKGGISGGVSYSSEPGRSAIKNDVWSANMGFRF